MPLRLGDAFVQDAGLLLVLVDLDITGCVLILNEQQRGGQGHRQSSEDGEQNLPLSIKKYCQILRSMVTLYTKLSML